MRKIVKPTEKLLHRIATGQDIMPYQYCNWWLYHRGHDTLLKQTRRDALYTWCYLNMASILKDLMLEAGMDLNKYPTIMKSLPCQKD